MKAEPKQIEGLARLLFDHLNWGNNYTADDLRPGNLAFHSSFPINEDNCYDEYFDSGDPDYAPDGYLKNGDPGMYMWRDQVELAVKILNFLIAANIRRYPQ